MDQTSMGTKNLKALRLPVFPGRRSLTGTGSVRLRLALAAGGVYKTISESEALQLEVELST